MNERTRARRSLERRNETVGDVADAARVGRMTRDVAKALGVLSIALGATELLAPRTTARAVRRQGASGLLRWFGLRELAAGAGLLFARDPEPWLWARIGGDALDLATVGSVDARKQPARAAFATLALTGIAAIDLWCAREVRREKAAASRVQQESLGAELRAPAGAQPRARDTSAFKSESKPESAKPESAKPESDNAMSPSPRSGAHS